MKDWFYPTAFNSWDIAEGLAMNRVITSNRFTQGEEVAAFEREFADYHGRNYGVMVNSGSSANLLMVAAMKELGMFRPGDRAIVPAIAWSTTYAPLIQHGLDLVIVDVDDTWNANPESFRVDPGNIKVVVAASILGNPAHLGEWANIAGAWVVELGELASLSRAEGGRVKQFVASRADKFRPPYGRVMDAYRRALELRFAGGKSVNVASVASFFVSRIDSAVDKILQEKMEIPGVGWFARANDTEGNLFGLMQPTDWKAK